MSELRPCPFCGGTADFSLNNEWFDGCYRTLYIKCMKCGTLGKPITFASSAGQPSADFGIAPTMNEAKVIATSYWNDRRGIRMKILKPGKVEMRKFVCDYCGCVFVSDETEVDGSNRLRCPTCEANLYWVNGEPYKGPTQDTQDVAVKLYELMKESWPHSIGELSDLSTFLAASGVTFKEDT